MDETPQSPSIFDRLSPREKQIAQLISNGETNRSVAARLQISPRTVEVHRSHVMEKLSIRKVDELRALVADHGFSHDVPAPPPLSQLAADALKRNLEPTPPASVQLVLDTVMPQVLDAKITGLVWADGFLTEPYIGLQLTKPDGSTAVLWCDADAGMNGPGCLRVEKP